MIENCNHTLTLHYFPSLLFTFTHNLNWCLIQKISFYICLYFFPCEPFTFILIFAFFHVLCFMHSRLFNFIDWRKRFSIVFYSYCFKMLKHFPFLLFHHIGQLKPHLFKFTCTCWNKAEFFSRRWPLIISPFFVKRPLSIYYTPHHRNCHGTEQTVWTILLIEKQRIAKELRMKKDWLVSHRVLWWKSLIVKVLKHVEVIVCEVFLNCIWELRHLLLDFQRCSRCQGLHPLRGTMYQLKRKNTKENDVDLMLIGQPIQTVSSLCRICLGTYLNIEVIFFTSRNCFQESIPFLSDSPIMG